MLGHFDLQYNVGFSCTLEEAPLNANLVDVNTCKLGSEVSKILSSVMLTRLQSKWRQCNLLLALLVDLFIEVLAPRQRLCLCKAFKNL